MSGPSCFCRHFSGLAGNDPGRPGHACLKMRLMAHQELPQPLPDNERELLQRRVARLQGLLQVYRWSLVACLLVIGTLVMLLFFAKAPLMGRAIIVDGTQVLMVRNEKAAAAVRQRLLAKAAGEVEGATFRQSWQDATRPVEGERVLSVSEAVRQLAPKLTVVREGFSIEDGGHRLVVVPTRQMAQTVLDGLKARYASPADAVVKLTKLRPEPSIRPCTVLPDEIAADEQQALACVDRARHRSGFIVVTVKETVTVETIPPPVERRRDSDLPKGDKKTLDPGEPGRKQVRWEVTMHNDREVSRRALAEEIVAQPRPKIIQVGSR